MGEQSGWFGLQVHGLTLVFDAAGHGGGFAGSAWRGLLGQALADRVCIRGTPACPGCPLLAGCAYPRLFKPLDAAALPPFWLHGWRRITRPAARWHVGLRWIGEQTAAVSEWLDALTARPGGREFGGQPARLSEARDAASGKRVWHADTGLVSRLVPLPLVDDAKPPASCRVVSHTPLVSKHEGDPLFGPLHTRLQRLVNQYGSADELPRLRQPWTSTVVSRKPRVIPLLRRHLSGIEWELDLTDIQPDAWELLQAGRELHAGGQTGLGCGHYEIVTSPRPAVATDVLAQ